MVDRRSGLSGCHARSVASVVFVCFSVGFVAAAEHPGQHLDVRVSINDQRVRFEIIMSADLRNLVILQPFTDFYLDETGMRFELVEQQAYAQAEAAFQSFFQNNNRVTVRGTTRPAQLKRLMYVPNMVQTVTADPTEFPPDARVVVEYPLEHPADRVALLWDLYPQDPNRAAFGEDPRLDVVAQLDAYHENKLIVFRPEEPEYVWHKPKTAAVDTVAPVIVANEPARWRVPVFSALAFAGAVACAAVGLARRTGRRIWLGAAGGALVLAAGVFPLARVEVRSPFAEQTHLPSAQEAATLFARLQENVYRAFDYKREDDIYDVLAESVAGEVLDEVYNEVFQSLVLRDQGGAIARVETMDVLDAELVEAGVLSGSERAAAFALRGSWRVEGAVYHWGHLHRRTNVYTATFTVAQRGDRWKITSISNKVGRRIPKPGDDPELGPLALPATSEPEGM